MLTILMVAALGIAGGVAYASCVLENGNQIGGHVGGYQDAPSGTPAVHVDGTLWNYNPTPVRNNSSFWVMLMNNTSGRYGQVGWMKGGGASEEHIFVQYTKDDGTAQTYGLDCESDEWEKDVLVCEPSNALNYEVEYDLDNDELNFQVNGYTIFTSPDTITWEPTTAQVAGEIHDGMSNRASELGGDHGAGHQTNHIHAEDVQVQWAGSSIQDADLSYDLDGMHYQQQDCDPGHSCDNWFRIWDDRCDE